MLRVDLRRSRLIAGAMIAVHAIALASLVSIQLAIATKLALAVAILVSLAHALSRHALLALRTSIAAIELEDGDRCTITQRDGAARSAAILGTSYVAPWLTVLNLRMESRTLPRHVIVVPDNVEAEAFRTLRVLLRWRRARQQEAAEGVGGSAGFRSP